MNVPKINDTRSGLTINNWHRNCSSFFYSPCVNTNARSLHACVYAANKSMKFSHVLCNETPSFKVLLTNCRDKSNVVCCCQRPVLLRCLRKGRRNYKFFFHSLFLTNNRKIFYLLVEHASASYSHDLPYLPERIKIRHWNFCYSNIVQESSIVNNLDRLTIEETLWTLHFTKEVHGI